MKIFFWEKKMTTIYFRENDIKLKKLKIKFLTFLVAKNIVNIILNRGSII